MRGFECIWYYNDGEKIIQHGNIACWAGIRNYTDVDIFIDEFTEKETKEYQEIIVGIVNKITPCSIVKNIEIIHLERTEYDYEKKQATPIYKTIKKRKLIKFHTLEDYDKNLILLNFIRYLWNKPTDFDIEAFFKTLEVSEYKDPLEKLMHANKIACINVKAGYGEGDHSNSYNANKLKIKDKEKLISTKFSSTRDFLTI